MAIIKAHLKIGMNMETYNNDISIPINLLRQWCFCPRVVYYQELLNIKTSKPLWVAQGEDFHIKISHIEKRRSFIKYGLINAKRHFNVNIKSEKYCLHGIIDCVIETDEQVFIVEHKINPKPNSLGHQLQLCGYAIIAEEIYKKPCTTGFLASDKTSFEINITNELTNKLITTIQNIKSMLDLASKPDSSATEYQCVQCEYINYCNDRL